MSTVAAVAVVVGAAASIGSAVVSAKAQDKARDLKTASQRIEDASRIRKQAREARVRRSKILASAEATGGGSRESGAVSSLSTQLSANVGRVAGQQKTAEALGGINQDIANAQVVGAAGSALQSVGSSAFSATGGFDNLFKDS